MAFLDDLDPSPGMPTTALDDVAAGTRYGLEVAGKAIRAGLRVVRSRPQSTWARRVVSSGTGAVLVKVRRTTGRVELPKSAHDKLGTSMNAGTARLLGRALLVAADEAEAHEAVLKSSAEIDRALRRRVR